MPATNVKSKWSSGNLVFYGDGEVHFGSSDGNLGAVKGYASRSSQTLENKLFELVHITDSSFLSGDDISYSGGYGSSMAKLTGTYTGLGGFEGIHIGIATSGALVASGAGVIGVKAVVTNTAHLVEGNVYGAQFIAKHNSGTNHMHAEACLVGLEAIGYDAATASAGVGVMLGVNAVIRSYATSAYGGGVHRGVQIIVDEATLGADEVTALCIWNMGASAIGGIRVVGANTMANMFYWDATGGCIGTTELVDNASADVNCDAHVVCSIGGTAYYLPLYNTKK